MTTMTEPSGSAGRTLGTLVFQIFIKATPEQIWEAITTDEFRRQYFFGGSTESTWQTGAPMVTRGPAGQLWGDNVILESDPPRLLSHTWRSLYDPELAAEPGSRVTWTIEPHDGGYSRLTVTHDGLEDSPKTAENVQGWTYIISGLKTLLETGRPMVER